MSPLRKMLFALVTLVGVLAATEVVVRLSTRTLGQATLPDDAVRVHVETEGLKYDPVLGWKRIDLPDAGHHIDENQFRRVVPIERDKPPGTWRAFTFGDSQTYGAGLHASETYSAVAERALQAAAPDKTVEVVNTGTSGYGSLQALRLMRDRVIDFEPDLYIVDAFPFDNPRDEVVPPASGAVAIERLLFRWRTYYVLRFAIERSRGRLRPMRAHSRQGDEIYAGNHDSIMALAAQQGVPVVFLDYPFWYEDRPADDPRALVCLAPPAQLPQGAVVIEICQALKTSGLAGRELFLDNNHMSETGARLAGESLADAILELGLLP